MWTAVTRFALVPTPILESKAVAQVPIFCPIIIGIAIPKVTPPVIDNACKIPTEAAELWMIPVKTVPIKTPKIGFENAVNTWVNSGISANGFIEPDINSIPYIRIAKPIIIPPTLLRLSLFEIIINKIPTKATSGEKDSGFKSLK